MRLIDADTLILQLNERYNEKSGIVPDNLAEGFVQVEKLIKEQPTAYNIDKMMGKFEELEVYYDNDYFGSNRKPMFLKEDVYEILKENANFEIE